MSHNELVLDPNSWATNQKENWMSIYFAHKVGWGSSKGNWGDDANYDMTIVYIKNVATKPVLRSKHDSTSHTQT